MTALILSARALARLEGRPRVREPGTHNDDDLMIWVRIRRSPCRYCIAAILN